MEREDETTHAPRSFSIGAAIGDGWGAFSSRYPLLLGASLLYLVIVVAVGVIASITSLFTVLPLVDWAAQFLFYPFMSLGLLYVGLRCVRGQRADVSMLFAGFGRYWTIVGVNAVIFFITIALFVPAAVIAVGMGMMLAFSGNTPSSLALILLISAGLVGFVVPMLYVFPRVMFATMVCFDPEGVRPGVTRSMRIAWRMTGRPGVHLRLVGLWLLSIPFFVVCALFLLLPVLFVAIPLSVGVLGAAYAQIARAYWYALRHCCRVCEYDLSRMTAGVCPECGTPIPAGQFGILGS